MKTVFLLVLLMGVLSVDGREGRLTLRNGDQFGGVLHGIAIDQGVSWAHPDVTGKLVIYPASVARVQLSPVASPKEQAHSARVRFVNGDELAMDLAGLTGEQLKMSTWFAGGIQAPRTHIQWLVPGGEGELIFNGPKGLRGWGAALMGVLLGGSGPDLGGVEVTEVTGDSPAAKSGVMAGDIITHLNGKPQLDQQRMIQAVKQHEVGDVITVKIKRGERLLDFKITLGAVIWKFENGALTSNSVGSMVGRKMKSWPVQSEFSFDLEWDNMPAMDIVLCADKVREYNSINGYKLRLYQNYAHLYRNTSPDGITYNTSSVGTASVNWAAGRKQAAVKVLIDQKKATLSLFVGGRLIKTWKDPQGFVGRGAALGFNPQLAGTMKVSAIRLRNWNGLMPSGKGPELTAVNRDLVQMQNGDTLSGAVAGIVNDRLTVKTGFAEVPVPLANISNIVFARPGERPDERPGTLFNLGPIGRVTGQLLDWHSDGVKIKSPLFGELTLDPAVITSVQFR